MEVEVRRGRPARRRSPSAAAPPPARDGPSPRRAGPAARPPRRSSRPRRDPLQERDGAVPVAGLRRRLAALEGQPRLLVERDRARLVARLLVELGRGLQLARPLVGLARRARAGRRGCRPSPRRRGCRRPRRPPRPRRACRATRTARRRAGSPAPPGRGRGLGDAALLERDLAAEVGRLDPVPRALVGVGGGGGSSARRNSSAAWANWPPRHADRGRLVEEAAPGVDLQRGLQVARLLVAPAGEQRALLVGGTSRRA